MQESTAIAYLHDIQHQVRIAEVGALNLDASLQSEASAAECLAAAQLILTSAAQVSKMLWPDINQSWPDARKQWTVRRGEFLRTVIEPNEILQRRAVRNSVEHYDERLDSVLFMDESVTLIDANVAPREAITIEGAVWLRHLDPNTMIYSALDNEVSLRDVMAALHAASQQASAWVATRWAGFTGSRIVN